MKYYVDHYCEIDQVFGEYTTEKFYDFSRLTIDPGAVYILGRTQLRDNAQLVRQLVGQGIRIIFSNPAEGSETFVQHLRLYGVEDLVLDGLLPCIAGGDLPSNYPHMLYDHFLTQPLRYSENLAAQSRTEEIYSTHPKPFKYWVLNGRYRPQRRALLNSLEQQGLLEHALWTNLDTTPVYHHTYNSDLLSRPAETKLLPVKYEVEMFQAGIKDQYKQKFAKNELFDNLWGEIYLRAEPYIDTYFSLVSETVFDYPYSLRSEKIYKPLAIGHPFIAVANRGFYRDLRRAGFQTYHNLIDESFDSIDNAQDRINRIVTIVDDLCGQDLLQLLAACESVCKYNQQHLREMSHKWQQELPSRFFDFLSQHP
jgi:hypothetical protein